jgi:adenosine/AMP kinase
MQLTTVKIDKPDDTNFILGQTHFIRKDSLLAGLTPSRATRR